jgi:hypothetical protein
MFPYSFFFFFLKMFLIPFPFPFSLYFFNTKKKNTSFGQWTCAQTLAALAVTLHKLQTYNHLGKN